MLTGSAVTVTATTLQSCPSRKVLVVAVPFPFFRLLLIVVFSIASLCFGVLAAACTALIDNEEICPVIALPYF